MTWDARILAALALAAIAALAPAAAQQPADNLPAEMRRMADALNGVRVGTGTRADKVVYFGRNAQGALLVAGIAALAPGAPLEEIPGSAIAAMRTRSATPNGNAAPDPADFRLAARATVPVFIVGEWSNPPVLWEIRRQGSGTAFRQIDARGVAGAWAPPPP